MHTLILPEQLLLQFLRQSLVSQRLPVLLLLFLFLAVLLVQMDVSLAPALHCGQSVSLRNAKHAKHRTWRKTV